MREFLLLFYFFLTSNLIFSQTKIDNNTRDYIEKIVQNYKPNDSTKIFIKLDSIYLNTKLASNKSYALFALAIAQHLSGNKDKYSYYLLKSKNESLNINDYYTLIDVYDAMSHNYLQLKLFAQALKYNEKSIEYINKIENRKELIAVAKNRQIEILMRMNDLKNIQKIIDELNILFKNSEMTASYVSNKSKFLYLKANYHLKLGRYEIALSNYYEYLEYIKNNKKIVDIQYFNAVVHSRIGLCLVKLNRYEEAIAQINQVKELVNESSIVEIYNYYLLLHEYYYKIGDNEKKMYYYEKILALKAENTDSDIKIVDQHLSNQTTINNESTTWYNVVLNMFGLVLIIDTFFMTFLRFKNKLSVSEYFFPYIIQTSHETTDNIVFKYFVDNGNTTIKETITDDKKFKISQKTIDSIIDKLTEFEKETSYLQKNYTMSNLCAELKVNTKYLNHVLKNEMNTDFNTYINNLKIQYIVKLLNTNIEARNYKLSYLAELVGFSSHSRFTQVFKQIVGKSPSSYLADLQ